MINLQIQKKIKFKEIKFRIQKAKVQLRLPLTGTRKWSEPGPATFTKTLGASSTSGGSTSRQGGVGKPKGVIYCMRGWTMWQAANCFQASCRFPPNIRRYCKNKNYKTLKPRDLNVWGKKKKTKCHPISWWTWYVCTMRSD